MQLPVYHSIYILISVSLKVDPASAKDKNGCLKQYAILKLLSVFYFQFVVILAGVCHICAFLLKKLSHY